MIKLHFAQIAVMVEFIKNNAKENGESLDTVEDIINYLDDNMDGLINLK